MMSLGRLTGAMQGWSNPDLLTHTLARRKAVQSSQIEGTKTELDELLTFEITQSADGLPADVRITRRYVEALQLGLSAVRANGRVALDCALIKRIHAVLMQDEKIPGGDYRKVQEWIGAGRIEDAGCVPHRGMPSRRACATWASLHPKTDASGGDPSMPTQSLSD